MVHQMPLTTRRRRMVETFSLLSAAIPTAAGIGIFAVEREFCPNTDFGLFAVSLLLLPFLAFWGLSSLAVWVVIALGASERRARRYRLAWFVVANLCMATLYAFPWSARQAFFRRADTVHVGMTVAEIDARLTNEHPVLLQKFDGLSGPSLLPVPSAMTGIVYYVRRDEENGGFTKDRIHVHFEAGRAVEISQYSD